ncbi:MAG TPA: hypothetical protein VFQ38_03575 [Longimicrobiales bacterium]|nr:hypothetical protein [Longimicrobiales bacterium]
MPWTILLWSGLAATLLMSWLFAAAYWAGITALQPGRLFGCSLLPHAPAPIATAAGRLLHFGFGVAVFPLGYALAFAWIGAAEAANGLLLGAAHGALVAAAVGLVPPERRCVAPGPFGIRLGPATPLVIVLAHMAYGALLGYVYVVPGT